MTPEHDLFEQLLDVENPGRYVGGEFGGVAPIPAEEWNAATRDRELLVAVCFPDTYEIGMSNTAIRLLYTMLNSCEGVRAERVFAPWPDFEQALSLVEQPLYTLESGIALSEVDIVAFSVGYELAATNILSVLQAGAVSLRNHDRGESEPLVLAGGPGISNPVPFGAFIDAVFVGEAEGVFPQLALQVAAARRAGASRAEQLAVLRANPHVWYAGKSEPTQRAIWNGFSAAEVRVQFPVAGVKAVQDHGTIEIMRGCPHGCRFCHAGVFYRPYRMKPVEAIMAEAEYLVGRYGYRDITLSSLSSGDYAEIGRLVETLNLQFAGRGVSFALPSLRVNSFTLPIIGGLAAVKKSGLTFAVETPTEWGQLVMNKQVSRTQCVEILKEAKRKGWRVAKFYFMIGLPVEYAESDQTEAAAIVEFVGSVQAQVGMNINLAVNTFVPKPHTAFQWAPQLAEEQALACMHEIRRGLKGKPVKVSWNSPFLSLLEGVITRGDERAGELIFEAFRRGARMDSWDEQVSRELWRQVFNDADWDVVSETIAGRDLAKPLPWDLIESGVAKSYLCEEYVRSRLGKLTEQCAPVCRDYCGICNRRTRVVDLGQAQSASAAPAAGANSLSAVDTQPGDEVNMHDPATEVKRLLVQFEKHGPAMFLPHLSVVRALERAAIRAGLSLRMSEGYNSHARMEFAQPLSLGVESREEVASIELLEAPVGERAEEEIQAALNKVLPEGISVRDCATVAGARPDRKKAPSLGAAFGGAEYLVHPRTAEQVSEAQETLRRLEEALSEREEVGFCRMTGQGLIVMLPAGPSGPVGITRLVERVCGVKLPNGSLGVTRMRCFARLDCLGDLVGEHDLLVDFLEFYRRWEAARTAAYE